MPLDSREKRASALGVGFATFAMVLPAADGTVAQADRQQTTFVYAGILAAAPVIIVASRLDIEGGYGYTYAVLGGNGYTLDVEGGG